MTPARPRRARGIRRVLLAPMLAIATLAALSAAYVAWTSLVATRSLEAKIADVRQANALASRLAQLAAEIERTVLSYRLTPSAALRERIARRDVEVSSTLDAIGRLEVPPRGRALWKQVVAARAVRAAERQRLLDAVARGDPDATARAYARWALAVDRSVPLLADLSTYNLNRLERATGELDRVRARATVLLVALLTASALLVGVFSLLVERWLVRPMKAITRVAGRIAEEGVEQPVPGAGRPDELGVLARSIAQMSGDLVRANAELAASVASRDEFLSVASHELKTPLTSLKLHLQAAERRASGAEPAPAWLGAALRQLARVETLVAELLDLARIRAGRLELRRQPVDVSDLVRTVAERLRVVLGRTGNALELDVPDGIAGPFDPGRLDQVVTNLLANAAQHAPGALVRLGARCARSAIVLVVEDAGPGIPDAARARVFAPYERAEPGRAAGGLGLGLHIASQIVAAHGGRIELSDSVLGGAAFTVVLPVEEAPAPPERSGASAPA